jgi:L-ascorbate metabolism protein UlaG (beta-lactamase superfamily)
MARFSVIRQLWSDVGRPISKAPHCPRPGEWSNEAVTASWLGHATVLMNFHGLWLLADPVFFPRVGIGFGPFILGPKRYVSCALRPRDLPPIDLVILSHAHMDHLDLRSLRKLGRDCEVIVPHDTSDLIRGLRFRKVHELGWKETRAFSVAGKEITITAQQLRHWGARHPWDRDRGYNAYILERAGRRICLAGDTARTDAAHLGERGPLDLMVVPISAYDPWITNHCTPEEAVEMADEAGANYLLPVHHETFKLSAEPLEEPIRRFKAALSQQKHRIALAQVGETFVLPGISSAPVRT